MPPKRPHTNPFGNDDDGGAAGGNAPTAAEMKKPRTEGPAGAASRPPPSGGIPSSAAVQAQLAAAKAKIDAQVAALRAKNQLGGGGGGGGTSTPTPTSGPPLPPSAPQVVTNAGAAPAAAGGKLDIAAIKRQVEEARNRQRLQQQQQQGGGGQGGQRQGPAQASTSSGRVGSTGGGTASPSSGGGGGIHPLLMQTGAVPASSSSSAAAHNGRSTPMGRRGDVGAAAARATATSADSAAANPYLTAASEELADSTPKYGRPAGSRSMHRTLKFNRQGRHIAAAEEARKEAELEALKKRIQESAKRVGIQEGLTREERRIKPQAPPDVEWWDAALLPSGNYDCVPDVYEGSAERTANVSMSSTSTSASPLIVGEGTPIDMYIQHPIPIPAPSDKFTVEPRGVMLTKKEMKKMRKQRRAAEQQDKQDRIKMGLQPPDPPKVKLSNLMRVLTSEAVADPTKVEARVRREVAARKEQHERDNAERALTPDQRREKASAKMEKDEAKGVFVCVYKIKHLVSGAHKFKVRKNAQQHGLTGLCIFHPEFALVVVEGPSKGIKAYKRLMTVRIDWTDPGRAKDDAANDEDDADLDPFQRGAGSSSAAIHPRHLAPMGEVQQPTQYEKDSANAANVDWSTNTCHLIFEGPQRERFFPQGFRARNADTDYDARQILDKWSGYWDVAKRFEEAQRDD